MTEFNPEKMLLLSERGMYQSMLQPNPFADVLAKEWPWAKQERKLSKLERKKARLEKRIARLTRKILKQKPVPEYIKIIDTSTPKNNELD